MEEAPESKSSNVVVVAVTTEAQGPSVNNKFDGAAIITAASEEAAPNANSAHNAPSTDDDAAAVVQQQQQRPSLRHQPGGRLSVRSMNFGIPTNQGAQVHCEEHHGTDSWRYVVLKKLHSTKLQMLLMGLLLLDVIIIFIEVFLLAQYPTCHTIERDAISCCPVVQGDEDHHHEEAQAAEDDSHHFFLRWLAESTDANHDGDDHHNFCTEGVAAWDYQAGCDEHKYGTVHTVEEVLFALTMLILTVFFVELNISMIALTPSIFFRQFFFLLDYIIVSVSLALELSFHFLDEAALQSLGGLLVAARFWRFLRIGHGIVEVTTELAHGSFENLLAYTEELEKLLEENDIDVPDSDRIRSIKHQSSNKNLIHRIEREHRAKHGKHLLQQASNDSNNNEQEC